MNLLYEKESYDIRGACFWVWREFGGDFKESVVEKALKEELLSRGLKVETQRRIDIFYKGKKVGVYVPDMIVNDCILVELKSKSFLAKRDYMQFVRYIKGSSYKLGFLVNFGDRLDIKRYVYDEARASRGGSVLDPRVIRVDRGIRDSSAFTLIEIMVVVGVTLVLTAMSIGYARSNKGQVALFVEQAKVVGLLNRAKSLALQGYGRDGTAVCYGVNFDVAADPQVVTVFKDITCDGFGVGDENVEEQFVDKKVEIESVSANDILFKPPYLEIEGYGDVVLREAGVGGGIRVVTVGPGGGVTMR